MNPKNLKSRFKATFDFFVNYNNPLADIYSDDLVKSAMKLKLREFQHPCAENEVVLDELVESIVLTLNHKDGISRFKKLGLTEYDHIGLIVQKFCCVAAVASY